MNTITMEVISEIEKELMDSPYDMTSLVFLLYEVPDTALQRLLVYQRVSKDMYSSNMNLLHEWMLVAKGKSSWREEFVEALLICQLYGIVRKLGFNVEIMKRQYQPENIHFSMYVNRIKKTMYKLCENIDFNNFNMLKNTLFTYHIDTTEYESCELVFLKLMSEKIITPTEFKLNKKSPENEFSFHKLVKLIHKLPGLEAYANELWISCGEHIEKPIPSSSLATNHVSDVSAPQPASVHYNIDPEFNDLFEMLSGLDIDNKVLADSKVIGKDRYQIKDPKNVGVCLIINQEIFHFCDQSIEDQNLTEPLSRRHGTKFDKMKLETTMRSLNFTVLTRDNLNHKEMIYFIKSSIENYVDKSTSIFMLCIMSHGVREHVYAADSIKVKVEDIQNILDSDDMLYLYGLPKVLIIQACQVDDDIPQTTLVADSPGSNQFRTRKMDFLVYWATAPQLEAFRSEEDGSIFIQFLCNVIDKRGKQERLEDIFTSVNRVVSEYCTKKRKLQAPVFLNSLRKKLYLFNPE